jgi:hypothetical protein
MNESRVGHGRVRFLAHIDKIKVELMAGHSLQETYEKFSKELLFNYSTFRRYVHQFIGVVPASRPRGSISRTPEPEQEVRNDPERESGPKFRRAEEPKPRFILNRKPDPKLLDLFKRKKPEDDSKA